MQFSADADYQRKLDRAEHFVWHEVDDLEQLFPDPGAPYDKLAY